MPQLSIGLPVYNGERFLEEALVSLLGQTFQDFELIISDNASTDGTQEICRETASKDSRIRYYRNDANLGAAWNYNHLFGLARSPFFKWASHDDVCAPTYLERCLNPLKQDSSLVLCYPQTAIIDHTGERVRSYDDQFNLTSPNPFERLKQFLFARTQGECNAVFGLVRTSFLNRTALIGRFNGSDSVLLLSLLLMGKFLEIPEELFFRRDHPETSIRSNTRPEDLALWFDPSMRRAIVLPRWRLLTEYVRSIFHAELKPVYTAQCLILMGKWMWCTKSLFWEELTLASKNLISVSS
ncbi:MAG: glycosyltransferase family 2 protein [Thermodesulfobacteriota bacterium]|nr:glycosyltransferase family 2 protein [Thermodesulfobacteriota bacterium]